MNPRRRMLLAGAAAALAVPVVRAQAYPSRPIKLILPNSPGSSVDKVSRALAIPLAPILGQPIVVENMAGSGGVIGLQQILRAPRDGYTVGIVSSNYTVLPSLYNLSFDARTDLVPVAVTVTGPFVLVVNPSVPVKNLTEFVALAKSRSADKSLTFGTPGVGSSFHLSGELLRVTADLPLLHVPYRGNNNFTTDLLGGQLDCGFLTPNVALPFLKAGKLRALAITATVRSDLLPQVPTIAESGYPGYSMDGWQAAVVANGTPVEVMQRLNAAINTVLKMPDIARAIADDGHRIIGGTVAQAGDWFEKDFERIGKLVKTIGLKPAG
ncbi:Bug family tripartite tricarboxylate transporter substrate binding protein [Hydrogenophaga sp. BPS33]|uniref:Bug family tripartite tricarboxylate transporter substrate binding protein n=1 Tax=Hydrogenophaga sp. BPS33 TaxID=2651974 RepID=UPI00135861E2|nr:tripartite tricarboxylate transporter substrate binding protein [Hydrogenophaga sp. BPS33]